MWNGEGARQRQPTLPGTAGAGALPHASQAQVLAAYLTLDQLLKLEPWEQQQLADSIAGQGATSSLCNRSSGDPRPPAPEQHALDDDLSGAVAPANAPPASHKRGPKRTVPSLPDLEAQLAKKQAEVERLERRNAQLKRRKRLLETVLACRDQQMTRLSAPAYEGNAAIQQAKALLQAASVQLPHMPAPHEYATMPVEHMIANYKCLLAAVSDALLAMDECNSSPEALQAAEHRLGCIITGNLYLLQHMLFNSPGLYKMTTLNINGQEQAASDEHYLNAAQVLNLTPEQADDTATLYGLLTRWKAEIARERQQVINEIAAAHDAKTLAVDIAGPAEVQQLEKLQHTVHREMCVISLVGEVFLSNVLTRVQYGQALVASHPHVFDALGIMAACARLHELANQEC